MELIVEIGLCGWILLALVLGVWLFFIFLNRFTKAFLITVYGSIAPCMLFALVFKLGII